MRTKRRPGAYDKALELISAVLAAGSRAAYRNSRCLATNAKHDTGTALRLMFKLGQPFRRVVMRADDALDAGVEVQAVRLKAILTNRDLLKTLRLLERTKRLINCTSQPADWERLMQIVHAA